MVTVHPRQNRTRSLTSHASGAHYENQAYHYLEQRGLRLIAKNVNVRGGEIDLIMKQDNVIVFIEVRYRRNALFGDAMESITKQKRQRIIHAARIWLNSIAESFDTVDCRFDVLAFTANEISWLKNAFALDR